MQKTQAYSLVGTLALVLIAGCSTGDASSSTDNEAGSTDREQLTDAQYLELMSDLASFEAYTDDELFDVAPAICGVLHDSASGEEWLQAVAIMTEGGVDAEDAGAASRYAVEYDCPEMDVRLPTG